jgi:DNA mismatch endonuclease (patch repair protein)
MNRSENMRQIRSKDTQPELRLRKALYQAGLRYRIHVRELPGLPDIVFPRARVAIFIHGCFWHSHSGCPRAVTPKTNEAYWLPKLRRTVERDRHHELALHELGYETLIVWECTINKSVNNTFKSVQEMLSRKIAR